MKRGDRGKSTRRWLRFPVLRQALPSPTPSSLAVRLKKSAQAAENGRFEPFKTTSGFDSTAKHPEWLG